jgi:hypothetical protein
MDVSLVEPVRELSGEEDPKSYLTSRSTSIQENNIAKRRKSSTRETPTAVLFIKPA